MSVLRSLLIVLPMAILLQGRAVAQTSVSLAFQNAAGEPVPITRAQLLVTAWGVSEQHDLPYEGNVVRLDLAGTRPTFADGISDTRGVVYVKADGYTPILSQAFAWPTSSAPSVIDFRNRQRVVVAQNMQAALTVMMRRPIERRIRVVDGSGRAMAGIKLEAAAYWNAPNHCGFLNGRDVLLSEVTPADGTLDVPDVDGSYAISVRDPVIVFTDKRIPVGSRGSDVVLTLTSALTTLHVRRYRREVLNVDIVDNGQPLPGAVLWADVGLGVCGAGYGPLATADAQGRVQVDDFYPEEWSTFWVCADRKQVWVLPEKSRLPRKIDVSVTPSGKKHMAASCGS
jgi:hypothetical protein